MASTNVRWMHVKDASFTQGATTINLNDINDVQFSGSSSVIGSSTEEDDFANHFLQAVEKSRSITLSSFDLAGLEALMNSFQGSKAAFSITIPSASESGGTSCISMSCTTSGCLVVSVDLGSSHNTEAAGSVQLEFASTGSASKLTVDAV